MQAQTLRGVFLASSFAVLSLALLGASCDKKTPAAPADPVPLPGESDPAPAPAPHSAGTGTTGAPVPKPGEAPRVDPSRLPAGGKARYEKLLETLQSPCGKAHSLELSLEKDPSCRRAPFAAAYVARRIEADWPDDDIEAAYEGRYLDPNRHEFDLADVPFTGVPNAPVVLVEFYDYGCPHCKEFKGVLEKVQAELPSEVVVYYKFFPLSGNPNGVPAAMAAVAAMKQGKFHEMHDLLFKNQLRHTKEDLYRFARSIGLDMDEFDRDVNDPGTRARVMRDREEGERAGVMGTPSLYINGRNFTDLNTAEDVADWVREELYVNR